MSLRIVPVTYETAAGFNRMWHRTHERPPPSHKFSIGVADGMDILRGVAIVGRPVSRSYDNGLTLEVNRTATDGTRNANSMLYGSCWNAAKALGFRRLITYNVTPTEGPTCDGGCPHESCFIIRASESGGIVKRNLFSAASVLGALSFIAAIYRKATRPHIPGLPEDGEPLSGQEVRHWIGIWQTYEAVDISEPVTPHRGGGGQGQ